MPIDNFYKSIHHSAGKNSMCGIHKSTERHIVKEQHIKDPEQCREALIASIRSKMDLGENAYEFEHRKSVVLVIGVNGVGKTTSIGKLADQLKAEGKKVGIICTEESRAMYPEGNLEVIGSREHEETVAHNLFAVLRDFDARKVDCIFSESFSKDQLGQAIMNRLCKAAGYHIVNV